MSVVDVHISMSKFEHSIWGTIPKIIVETPEIIATIMLMITHCFPVSLLSFFVVLSALIVFVDEG